MSSTPHPFLWPSHIRGKARLASLSKSGIGEYVSFEIFRNDDSLYNEVNWRWLRNGKISQNEFELSTQQNYERNLKEQQSFLGRFMVNDVVDIVRTGDGSRIYMSGEWFGKFKDWVDVELNLYNFRKYIFFDEKKVFVSAYTSGTRRICPGSVEHIVGGERPGDTQFWSCKGEFQITWDAKELRLFCNSEWARNGVKNNGFRQDATFLLI